MTENHISGKEQLQACTTLKEILEQAIEFECTARDFYADLALKVTKRIRYLLDELVIEEQAHYDLFTSLLNEPDVIEQIQQEIMTPPGN
ncbi:MAG: rubrerythrin, partial [gamma proteobacterium symbiont of Taylorina sp.]|nr:rubrerythrin [gamma proteobacterium symbiont of Taylorina sp.]